MTSTTDPTENRSAFLRRAIDWLLGRRFNANVGRSQMSGGGQKLQPIADVLARTGREPRAPE